MKRLIPISAALALAMTFSETALAAESVSFLLDWLPAGDKAAVYLGVEKGLFEAEGIKVTIQSGRGSSDVVTKLATGSADMGTGGLAALLQVDPGALAPMLASGKVDATINWITVAPAFAGPLTEAGKSFKELLWSS